MVCLQEIRDRLKLTVGNHELLLADVAYQTFAEIARFW